MERFAKLSVGLMLIAAQAMAQESMRAPTPTPTEVWPFKRQPLVHRDSELVVRPLGWLEPKEKQTAPAMACCATAASPELQSPLRSAWRVTSSFGPRRHPIRGTSDFHRGVDLGAPLGTPVLAAADGVVEEAGSRGAAGRMVRVRHERGLVTSYLHLGSIAVRSGERVAAGAVLGTVGQSGVVTGPHLEYRVSRNGTWLDPVSYQNRAGGTR